MRNKKYIVAFAIGIVALLAVILVLVLINHNKKSFQQGGEETNFPYFWKEERGGSVLIRLDGSYGPQDYHWTISSSDEDLISVKVVKKEKNGVITYRIKPLKEGSAQIVFSRQREVETLAGTTANDTPESKEIVETSVEQGMEFPDKKDVEVADEQGSEASDELSGESVRNEWTLKVEDGQTVQDSSEEEDPSEAAEAASAAKVATQRFEEYMDRFRAKDAIAEVKVRLEAEPVGKKNKLKLTFALAQVQEHKGIMQSKTGEGEVSYQVWEDSKGAVQVRLPELGESWSASWDGEYVPPEDEEIPGLIVSRPEMVDGRYVILEIRDEGYVEGAYCYTLQGLEQGSATIEFSNPKTEESLLIYVMISRDGKLTVISHGMAAPQG